VFHESETEIRALAFADHVLDLRVSGAVTGKLQFTRQITNNVSIYSLPMALPAGRHMLHKEGDWSGDVTFVIGETIDSFWEIPYIMRPTTRWTLIFILAYLPALFLILPWVPSRRKDKTILAEFNGLKTRLLTLPKVFHRSICVATVACILIPVSLLPIEDRVGLFFVVGNFLGGTFRWHYMGAEYGLCYLFCVFYPIVIVADAWITGEGKIIAVAVLGAALCGFAYKYVWLIDMFGIPYAVTSPMMSAVPVWLFGNLSRFIASSERPRSDGDEEELLPAGLHNK
jgi:hypothetical protein